LSASDANLQRLLVVRRRVHRGHSLTERLLGFRYRCERLSGQALGEGDMNYAAIATALREINFQGDAIIELAHESDFKPTRPLRESLKMSREFVRRVFRY
jgi:sugar phosphate isomerase/epimerase